MMEILFNNRILNRKLDDIVHVNDRLAKDVEVLMNSTYWINALKSRKAIGIGEQLYFQLAEAQNFINDFIRFCVISKKFFLKSIQKIENINRSDTFENLHHQFITNLSSFSTSHNNCSNNTKIDFFHKSKEFIIHTQFIVECIILAILDSDNYIGTISDIIDKIIEWFPEMKKSYENHIKPFIEYILNTIPCFKRLMNSTKSKSLNRPIILGKRQYIWSIDANYLRNFVKHFSKQENWREMTYNEHNNEAFDYESVLTSFTRLSNDHELKIERPTLMDIENLFTDWKYKIEKFKLLMQVKHNNSGFIWLDSFILKQNDEILKMFEFMQYEKTPNMKKRQRFNEGLKCLKLNESLLFTNCEKKYKSKRIHKPNITKVASSSKSKSSLVNCVQTNLDEIFSPTINKSSSSTFSSVYSNESSQMSSTIIDLNSYLKNKQSGLNNNNKSNLNDLSMIETNTVSIPQQSDNIFSNPNNGLNLINITPFPNVVYNFGQSDLHVPLCVVDSSVEELLNNDFRTDGDLEKFMYF